MKVSDKAIKLIKHHEGVRSKPYKCPAGLWTVGVGTLIGDGKSLPPEWNRKFTMEEVDALLRKELAYIERRIGVYITYPISQDQFDALCSFVYNLGLGTLQRSILRQRLNRGDIEGAAEELLTYNKAKDPKTGLKKVLKGLDLRRKAECLLLLA